MTRKSAGFMDRKTAEFSWFLWLKAAEFWLS